MIRIAGVDMPSTINEYSDIPHGTYYMASHTNLYEPQRSNSFEFVATNIDDLVRPGTNSVVPNGQEVIRMSVISAFVPHFTLSDVPVKRGNTTLHYAGVPTFNGGTITCNDFIGADTKSVLQAWQALAFNVYTEKVGHASDYKRDCYLIEYTPDHQKVRQWIMHGCWVSGISEGDYSAEGADKKTLSITIIYDRAEVDVSEWLDEEVTTEQLYANAQDFNNMKLYDK